ncbi:hypothetical protein [Litoribacillus peritrichatus]|uniref:Oxidoreductase molybdopterin-binding domain-containing protein n=1 Tax=Litoribacillus peritrichatus TaxID=718191 RepID=A0ABP7NCF2_9GAMM
MQYLSVHNKSYQHGLRVLTIFCLLMTSHVFGYELTLIHQNTKHTVNQSEFHALTNQSLVTITPWTDEPHTFQGATLASLLKHFKIEGKIAKAKALNDYVVEIDLQKAIAANAFVVSHIDNQPMRVRNKGPFWIIFPWSEQPELNDRQYQDWSIWQMIEINVE